MTFDVLCLLNVGESKAFSSMIQVVVLQVDLDARSLRLSANIGMAEYHNIISYANSFLNSAILHGPSKTHISSTKGY